MKVLTHPFAARHIPYATHIVCAKSNFAVLVILVDYFRDLQTTPVINAVR